MVDSDFLSCWKDSRSAIQPFSSDFFLFRVYARRAFKHFFLCCARSVFHHGTGRRLHCPDLGILASHAFDSHPIVWSEASSTSLVVAYALHFSASSSFA
ncbi:unnamed protein product [Macrosiphum euphorbiae]|uniref:Uncharacterized protein n=1 Tax=Macrosiphum euphorbiae TaxID=13131 RepID=A0AAV0WHT0_9HEMI|nr:unnamed protein product [Macrosiphum euphorbiae]